MKDRWLARSAFVLMLAAVAVLIGFAELGGLVMIVIGVIGAVLVVTGVYLFLAHRGLLRWIAAAVVILTPVAILVLFALHNLIWVALVSVALLALAAGAGQAGAHPGGSRPRHACPRGPAAQARVPDHEPEVGRREGYEVRAEGEGRGAGGRGGAARGPGHRGRGGAGPAGGRRRRGPARGGRGRRDPGAGGRDRRRARPAVPGDQRRYPQPLRDGPRAGPGEPGRLPGRPHRRRGTADRPGDHRRPHVREQRLVRRLRRDRGEPGLPGRQGGHDAADAARDPERPPGGQAVRPAAGDATITGRRPCW